MCSFLLHDIALFYEGDLGDVAEIVLMEEFSP